MTPSQEAQSFALEVLTQNAPPREHARAFLQLSPAQRDEVIRCLKEQADALVRTDLKDCVRLCGVMQALAEASGDPRHRALALLARGNAHAIGEGAFEQGVAAYERAGGIYASLNMPVEQARSLIGKIYALANLGRYEQALSEAEWARRVLREHGEWLTLARLKVNMALLHSRLGDDLTALSLLDLAKDTYRRLGVEGEAYWPRVEHNRAVVLRNLGRFEAALQAAQIALQQHERLGQRIAAARARQNLAMTYFVMGEYNRALDMLWEARAVFEADGGHRHVLMVDLFIGDCLLHLCQYEEVIERCTCTCAGFEQLGNRYEAGQALMRVARAWLERGEFRRALEALEQARLHIEADGSRVVLADLDLQVAELSLRQGDAERARSLAESCAAAYQAHQLPIPLGNAWRLAAQAALAQNQVDTAQTYLEHLRRIVRTYDWPNLRYRAAWLEAQLAGARGELAAALRAYERALEDLEHTRNALMVEHRSRFLEGKQALYEDTVALSLFLGHPLKALQYAERAKSRALLDLLAHRLDLSVQARTPEDEALVQELRSLQEARNRLWRHQAGAEEEPPSARAWQDAHALQQRLLGLEKRIADLWHMLLVRNADYARDASLWRAPVVAPQEHLPPGTALLEYFAVHGSLLVFVVTARQVRALVLDVPLSSVQRSLQVLLHNLHTVSRLPAENLPALTENVRGVLHALYRSLLAACEPYLEGITHLQVVPHDVLHYLPFHAFFDGERYLVERFSFSYLPASSVLPYCRPRAAGEQDAEGRELRLTAFGHSFGGALPHAVEEARQVASLWGGEVFLEHQATRARFRERAAHSHILHLAAHGEFRSDMPLFSGIALADGWLSALDVFNQRMNLDLVTLSACQSGRSVIGAGDELQGLTRAFLAGGAASLLVSLWPVPDFVTAGFMLAFYRALRSGESRAAALRRAQRLALAFPDTAHPYFWASFTLSGAWGKL